MSDDTPWQENLLELLRPISPYHAGQLEAWIKGVEFVPPDSPEVVRRNIDPNGDYQLHEMLVEGGNVPDSAFTRWYQVTPDVQNQRGVQLYSIYFQPSVGGFGGGVIGEYRFRDPSSQKKGGHNIKKKGKKGGHNFHFPSVLGFRPRFAGNRVRFSFASRISTKPFSPRGRPVLRWDSIRSAAS